MFVVPFDGGSVKSMHSHLPRLNGSLEMILTTLKRNDSMMVRRCVLCGEMRDSRSRAMNSSDQLR